MPPFDTMPFDTTPFDETPVEPTPFDTTPFDKKPLDHGPFDSRTAEAGSSFALVRYRAVNPGELSAWLALPARPDPHALPLVAVHGIHRGARSQALRLGPTAASQGRVVIAPCFPAKRFAGYQRVIGHQRADLALLRLLGQIGAGGCCDTRRFDLFGYSGGAQFAHRFALLCPHRISRLTVLSAGWYTYPNDERLPYGLGQPRDPATPWAPLISEQLAAFLGLPIQVCVGDRDDQPDANTRNTRRIDKTQGTNRLERARRWHRALIDAARARGITPRIALHVLPGCGHDFYECVSRDRVDRIALDIRQLHADAAPAARDGSPNRSPHPGNADRSAVHDHTPVARAMRPISSRGSHESTRRAVTCSLAAAASA